MESWIVDYQVIHGSPSETETWDKADELLKGRYRHASGAMLTISAAFVDSGGSATQDVYNFTSSRKRRNVFAVKGHSRPNRPIVSGKPSQVSYTWRGNTEKKGTQLWMIGPDTSKDYLQSRWARTTGAGAVHFSKDLPESYFKGLTAEFRTYDYKRGRKVSWWEQKKGEANEPLDLMVYNLGAAYYLGLHKKSEHGWQSLRDRLVPLSGDLFQQDPPASQPAATPVHASAQTNGNPNPVPDRFAESTPPPQRQTTSPAAPVAQPSKVYGGKISLGTGTRRGG
jgi:phage terminase large subunit GpA-like protein